MRKFFTHYHTLNKVGMWLSMLCMIHCLAMPFLITILPFLGENLIGEKTEYMLIGASFALAIFLLQKDYQNHQNKIPFVFLGVAILLNLVGIFFSEGSTERFFHISGALALATAYYLNWHYHRRACHSHRH